MAININLFPPTLDTYLPAFLIGGGNSQKNICRVYFSISLYNSLEDIKNVQVTVANQYNNLSVLDREKYPCEIMLAEIQKDLTRTTDDKYYIEIKPSDIQDGFQINQYYKVQLRFTSAEASSVSLSTPQAIDAWLAANLSNFSEWSSVCLIRGISLPTLSISGFDNSADTTLWSLNNVDLVGHLSYADAAEQDTLKSYQIKLYDFNNNLLLDSGILYTNTYSNINEFNYTFNYAFNEGDSYYFTLEYETANMYKEIKKYDFMVVQESADTLNAKMTVALDNENARMIINIQGQEEDENFIGNITIRRSSSETNFTIWEDIHTQSFENGDILNYTWYDNTIKSGVYYKYLAQKRSSVGNRGIALYAENAPFMILFDDMYLTGGDHQLRIKFDPSISSFKRTLMESRTETIGAKYPFIKRNGNTNYRQFPISGTISHLIDTNEHLLTSREEVFKDSLDNYNKFNEDNRINDYNDWIYEREFREKVMDFLYADKVRLFRSTTEGNILVRLMDISLTPNITLGRRIYSFAATAYEVDDCSIENYNKYGILSLGNYNTQLQFSRSYIGQLNEKIPANKEVLDYISEKYQKDVKEGYLLNLDNLDYLRIEMEDKPYLIGENEEGPYAIQDETDNLATTYLGYLIYINNKPIVINPEGIYELRGNNVKITSIKFPIDTKININYNANTSQKEDPSQVIQTSSFYKKVGQVWGSFKPNTSIYQQIWNKYFEKYSNYTQILLSLDEVKVEANPGTVVYVKESADKEFERHVIGPTATLDLNTKDSTIEGLYFAGIHLEEANEIERQRDLLPDNKFIETNIILDKNLTKDIQLIKNGVYTLADDYLEVLNQFNNKYSLKSKKQWFEESSVSVNQNNIEKKNKDYTLLLDRVIQSVSDDGGILIDEEWIEQVGDPIWTGSLYVDGTEDSEKNTQNNLNNEEDLIKAGDKKYRNNQYSFKSKEQWPNKSQASINKTNLDKSKSPYIIKLNRVFDQYYNLVLNKEVDRQYALILQRLIDEANSRYIWYNNEWWLFTKDNDLLCPVEALIDYTCEIMKGRLNS